MFLFWCNFNWKWTDKAFPILYAVKSVNKSQRWWHKTKFRNTWSFNHLYPWMNAKRATFVITRVSLQRWSINLKLECIQVVITIWCFYWTEVLFTSFVIFPCPSKSYNVNDHSCLEFSPPPKCTPHSNSWKKKQNYVLCHYWLKERLLVHNWLKSCLCWAVTKRR